MDDLELGWIVGFFEGEGHIYIPKQTWQSPCVGIAQKDREPLDWIHSHFGGGIYGGQGPKKNSYTLRMGSGTGAVFLRAVQPLLRLEARKEKAVLYLALFPKEIP